MKAYQKTAESVRRLQELKTDLKDRQIWCLWKAIQRDNGKIGKVPHHPNGKPYRINTDTPHNFKDAMQALQHPNNTFDGLGIILGDGLCGIDIDGTTDHPLADLFFPLYTEYSPSKTGLHILFDAPDWTPPYNRKNDFEIYSDKRFFTFTGDKLPSRLNGINNIHNLSDEFKQHFHDYLEAQVAQTQQPSTPLAAQTPLTPQTILIRATKDQRFQALYNGQANFTDRNEADWHLCLKLCFYTAGNADLIDAVFRQSALMRDKWDSKRGKETYGQRTITKAIAAWDGNSYKDHQKEASAQPKPTPKTQPIHAETPPDQNTTTQNTGGLTTKTKEGQPAQSELAAYLVMQNPNLSFDPTQEEWMHYNGTYWEQRNKAQTIQDIDQQIDTALTGIGYSASYLQGVIKLLAVRLGNSQWNTEKHLIPFQNGVLNTQTRQLTPHDPKQHITWAIPYDYNPHAQCPNIQQWLLESVDEWEDRQQLLRAYIAAVLHGRSDLQRYLELIGPGGTGKGTFIRLCESLIGHHNAHSTSFESLENDKFETANLYNKRLIT
ncbi:MAG: DUF5906 domain-containing protein, partial [Myxococcota bacterium]